MWERSDIEKNKAIKEKDLAIAAMNSLERTLESLMQEASAGEKGINSLKRQKQGLQSDLEKAIKNNQANDQKAKD